MNKFGLMMAVLICLLLLATGCSPKSPTANSPANQLNSTTLNSDNITTVEDLTGRAVGVSLGSGSDMLLTGDNRYNLMRYDTPADALMGLKNNSVAAVAVEITTAREFMKSNEGLSVINGHIGSENYGVAVAKGNDALKYKIDVFIDYLKESGAYDNLVGRWIRTGSDSITMPEFATKPGDVWRVGIDATYTPFEYLGENGELLGFDIEFIRKMAEFYGLQLEFYESTFSSLFVALDAHEVDMVISAVAITSDRQERYNFSQPYYENEIVFVVKTPQHRQIIKHVAELSGKSIGVAAGTNQDSLLSEQIPGALLFYYNDRPSELKSLRAKRIDAVAVNTYDAQLLSQYNSDLSTLPEQIEYGQIAFATTFNNSELAQQINTAIRRMKDNGVYSKLRNKWFNAENAPLDLTEVDLKSTRGQIRFGVATDNTPYAYTSKTRMVGLDIDLMRLAAAENGLRVEVVEIESDRLVQSLLSGQVDIIGGGLRVPPGQSTEVWFAMPYDSAYLSIVVWQDASAQSSGFWTSLYRSFYNNLIKEARYKLIWFGLWETILIALLAILIGTLLGALLCFLKRSTGRVWRMIAATYIRIIQGIPILVILLIVCYVIFANSTLSQTIIAVIAFSAYFAAYVGEILDSGLSTVAHGQWEAATALGYTRSQAFLKHILPQAAAQALPIYRGQCISLIKDTSIVGFIAILDLTKASDIIRSRTYEAFFPLVLVAIIYFIIAWALTFGLRVIESRLDTQKRKRSVAL
jgi:polar amino acid transport system substrate-binding protein